MRMRCGPETFVVQAEGAAMDPVVHWDPYKRKTMEELMGQLSPRQIDYQRKITRLREQHLAEGVLRGRAEGMAHERAMLARLKGSRRFESAPALRKPALDARIRAANHGT